MLIWVNNGTNAKILSESKLNVDYYYYVLIKVGSNNESHTNKIKYHGKYVSKSDLNKHTIEES